MEASANDQVTALSPVRSSRQIVFLMLLQKFDFEAVRTGFDPISDLR
jgi:hypothetical protein